MSDNSRWYGRSIWEMIEDDMTDRSESDRIVQKWRLIQRLDEARARVHAGVIDTWKHFKRWRRGPRTQHEIDTVIALALHQLAECDRMEQSLKR